MILGNTFCRDGSFEGNWYGMRKGGGMVVNSFGKSQGRASMLSGISQNTNNALALLKGQGSVGGNVPLALPERPGEGKQ